ncbi:MAG: sodium:solute symporter family protein, partial [Bacteroidota bacterium]
MIGLRAGSGIKDIREYATANKSFGTVALILTFLATNVAGESILDLAGEVNKTGIILSVVFIVGVGGLLLIQALFIAPNITYFDSCITMGDVMEVLYGSNSKIITGILGFFTAICVAGMEIIVLGLLCELLLGIDYRWGVGLGGVLLAAYSAYGGIKSVTATDIFQFIILLVVMPMITVLALKQAGGIKAVFIQVPTEKFRIINHPNFHYYLVLLICKVVFQFSMIDPALMQRFLMAKSRQQLRNKFLTLSVFSSALYLTIMLAGLAGVILYPSLSGVRVIPMLINNLLPIGIKGLAIAGLIAVTMATIDSFLHAAGLTFTHDVVKPLCDKSGLVINELKWTQYITIFVSLFAIIIGFTKATDLYSILLVSYEFTCPILAFPLWGGIIGLKPDKAAFYVAAGFTVVTLLLARWLLPESQSYLSALIGVSVNGIIFMGMHIFKNKGLSIISRRKEYAQTHIRRRHRAGLLGQLYKLLPTPQNIVSYSRSRVLKYGASYMLLGIFFILNYIIPYFMWEYDNTQAYELTLYLRLLGAIACGLLIVKDKWPNSLIPYLPSFWHLTLLYCLPFTSTVMFLITQGSVEWLINIAITIMFLIV